LASGLALQFTKFDKMAKGEASISVAVALSYELGIEHRAVGEVGVGEGAAVFVFVLGALVSFVENYTNVFPFDGVAGELLGFFAETLDRLFRMNRFRSVDADQAYSFVRADDNCVAVDDADDFSKLAGWRAGFFRLR